MANVLKKSLIGLAAVSTIAVTASPADAQYRRYRHHRGDDAAVAIGAGIIGLGIGAAIASGNNGYYGRGYYGNGYYGRGYGYDRGYGYGYGYGYGRRHCVTRREFDPYWGRWVRVRYC
jgi:hypothetical protein